MDGSVEIDAKGTYLDIEIGSPHRLFSTVYRCPKYQLFLKKFGIVKKKIYLCIVFYRQLEKNIRKHTATIKGIALN